MNWTDEGFLLNVSPLGEDKLILNFFTHHHGRQNGITKRSQLPFLPGSVYWIDCGARLPESLGTLKLEPLQNYPNHFTNPELSLLFQSFLELLNLLTAPKDPHSTLYEESVRFLKNQAHWPNILASYCKWELELLKELGFGLSLEKCIVTRETSNLRYVSPKSACAVSAQAGQAYKQKLLKLPKFLIEESPIFQVEDLIEGLTLTGYFLEHKLCPQFGKEFPTSRKALYSLAESCKIN